jgi:hypothetical protein
MDVQTQLYYEVVIPFIQYSVLALCLLAALSLLGWWRQRRSDVMRETYEIFTPSNKTYEDVVDLMRSWSSLPKPRLGKAIQAICLDRFADYSGEHLYLTIAGRTSARLDELFYQHLDATLEPVEYDPVKETVWDKAVELSLSGYKVPLRIGTPTGVAGTFSAHLKNIPDGHSVCMQFVISSEGARTPTPDDRDKVTDPTPSTLS